jgi:malate permease and related proteins
MIRSLDWSALPTVASIFLLLLVGYGTKKLRILSVKDTGVINSIVVNLALPAFIFSSIHGKPLEFDMIKAPFIGIAVDVVVLVAAYLIARLLKLDRPTTAGLMIAASFGNTGYMGLPIVSAVFKGDGGSMLTAAMMDSFAMRIMLCTVGIAVATTFAGREFDWRCTLEFVKSPLFGALVIALLLRKAPIPEFLMSGIDKMGGATVPLSMISVGLNLSMGSVGKWPLGTVAAALLKMAAMPALMCLGVSLMHIDHSVSRVAILEMGMPSAIFGGVIAGRYGANKEFVAGAIFLSTLLSVVVIPVVVMLVK